MIQGIHDPHVEMLLKVKIKHGGWTKHASFSIEFKEECWRNEFIKSIGEAKLQPVETDVVNDEAWWCKFYSESWRWCSIAVKLKLWRRSWSEEDNVEVMKPWNWRDETLKFTLRSREVEDELKLMILIAIRMIEHRSFKFTLSEVKVDDDSYWWFTEHRSFKSEVEDAWTLLRSKTWRGLSIHEADVEEYRHFSQN